MTASNQHSRLTAADAIRGLREVQNALRDNGMFATELKVKLAVDVLVEQLEVACEALWQLADAGWRWYGARAEFLAGERYDPRADDALKTHEQRLAELLDTQALRDLVAPVVSSPASEPKRT